MVRKHKFKILFLLILISLLTIPSFSFSRLKYIDVLSPIPNSTIKNSNFTVSWFIKDSKGYTFKVKIIDTFTKKVVYSVQTNQLQVKIPLSKLKGNSTFGLSIEGYKNQTLTAVSRYLSFKIPQNIEEEDTITLEEVKTPEQEKEDKFQKIKDFFISRKGHLSTLEKTSWWLLKYVLGPSLSSVIFVSTAGAFPPLALMAGELAVGGITTGLFNYLYDKRMNQLGLANKSEEEMRFDAITTALSRMATLPFYVVGGNIAGVGAQLGVNVILKQALLGGLFRFGASTIGSGLAGIARHYLAHNYLKIDEKIRALEQQKYFILAKYTGKSFSEIPPADKEKLAKIEAEIQKWKSKDYTIKNFKMDIKKGLVNGLLSGWGGALPKAAINTFARTELPARISTKIFGGPSHSTQIAELILLHPFTFISGYSNAKIEEDAILKDISYLKAKQSLYPPKSMEWNFYQSEIEVLKKKYENISPVKRGAIEMATMAGIKFTAFGYEALKARLIDLPAQKRTEIDKLYKSKVPHWQKANQLKEKYEKLRQHPPQEKNFKSVDAYLKAKLEYDKKLSLLKDKYQTETVRALYLDKAPQNQNFKKQLAREYEKKQLAEKEIALAKYLGKEKYKQVLIRKMKKMPQYKNFSTQRLNQLVEKQLKSDYQQLYLQNEKELKDIETKLSSLKGNTGSVNTQVKKMLKSGLVIKPSEYKSKYIEMKINQLRAQGISDSQIKDRYYSDILNEASQRMRNLFGKTDHDLVVKELIASYLKQGKYDSEKSLSDKIKEVLKSSGESLLIRTLGETGADVNKYIVNQTIKKENKKLPPEVIDENTVKILDKIYLDTLDDDYHR